MRLSAMARIEQKWELIEADEKLRTIDSLQRAGQFVMRLTRASILTSKKDKPAPVGQPVRTRRGQIRRATLYEIEPQRRNVVVGPTFAQFADVGKAHEYGGWYRGEQFPARPFMTPALDRAKSRLASFWGSVSLA